eukprot:SAG31_NODE_3528_length_4153_cov_1.648249_5_plen_42_part_00
MWGGASLQNLTTVTDMIKADWPESIVFINEVGISSLDPNRD